MTDISYATLSTATTVGTGNATDGTGNFDNLMKVVTLHLEDQFTAGRITGTDYATVYLGALQSTLAQAVNFTLSMNKANEDATLTEKQQSKVEADTALVGKQDALVTQQKLTEVQSTSLATNQAATELKKALDLASSTSVRNAQSSADTTLKGKQGAKIDADELLVDATKLKVDSETTLLGKKGTTEDKQIAVMTQQILLFIEQASGFKWNANAKYLKTLLDAKGLNDSLLDAPVAVTNLEASNINTQIANLIPS